MLLALAGHDDLQEPWTWLAMAKHGDVVLGHGGAKQKPSGHDDGNADDPGGNERMAKTAWLRRSVARPSVGWRRGTLVRLGVGVKWWRRLQF